MGRPPGKGPAPRRPHGVKKRANEAAIKAFRKATATGASYDLARAFAKTAFEASCREEGVSPPLFSMPPIPELTGVSSTAAPAAATEPAPVSNDDLVDLLENEEATKATIVTVAQAAAPSAGDTSLREALAEARSEIDRLRDERDTTVTAAEELRNEITVLRASIAERDTAMAASGSAIASLQEALGRRDDEYAKLEDTAFAQMEAYEAEREARAITEEKVAQVTPRLAEIELMLFGHCADAAGDAETGVVPGITPWMLEIAKTEASRVDIPEGGFDEDGFAGLLAQTLRAGFVRRAEMLNDIVVAALGAPCGGELVGLVRATMELAVTIRTMPDAPADAKSEAITERWIALNEAAGRARDAVVAVNQELLVAAKAAADRAKQSRKFVVAKPAPKETP